MTVTMPFGRMLTRQILPRSNPLLTRLTGSNPLLRVSYGESTSSYNLPTCRGRSDDPKSLFAGRTYATAASKPAGRPKAHTGRTSAKKPAGRASTKSKSTTSRKKPASKPKTRAKPKAKPKKTRKIGTSKHALNQARIARTKTLKARALLSEPKQLPSTAWAVYFSEQHKVGSQNFSDSAAKTKEAAQKFKTLPAEEHERLNHTANQNKAKNEAEYKKWVSQHTPAEIKDANNARRTLNQDAKSKGTAKKAPVRLIKDDRLVKQTRNAYTYFTRSRWASGDFKNMKIAESARLIGREWKQLSASERKTFEDQAKVDHDRYVEEYQTVYGEPLPQTKAKKA